VPPYTAWPRIRLLIQSLSPVLQIEEGQPGQEPRVTVEAEDSPGRWLLETKIVKDDGFQKQQGVWEGKHSVHPATNYSNDVRAQRHLSYGRTAVLIWP